MHFYKNPFSEDESHYVLENAHFYDIIPSLVLLEENDFLTTIPSEDKVRRVLFGLNVESALGLDGFNDKSFHSCRDFIGVDVVTAV